MNNSHHSQQKDKHTKKQQMPKVHIEPQQRLTLLRSFLQKNQSQLQKGVQLEKVKATVVPDTQQYLPVLGKMIRNGQLVGFPTQTVYGLGADATNESALLQIYRVKRRPLTDPIIVHVLDFQQAEKLVQPQSQAQLKLFKKLTEKYWPGPLTVILKANLQILPKVVTAQTGFVGIRSPKSKFARQLIAVSQKPIGAPSANLFSHVSPTSATHVLNDFYDQDIAIVDGHMCQYGVESTVLKIVDNHVEILRQGSLSTQKLKQYIKAQFGEAISVQVKKRVQKQDENKNMQAPGQLLKHYAPYLPCFSTNLENLQKSVQQKITDQLRNRVVDFSQSALISFCSQFQVFKQKFKFYLPAMELDQRQIQNQENDDDDQKFCTLEQKKKMRSLYYLLRKAQNLDVKVILIGWNEPKEGTLWDKIFRSTQGHTANLF